MTSEALPRRLRNKLDKRARIQAAALELFSTKGFDETTTKAVAEAAGVATGTVFLYATDKSDLLMMAMRDELARIVEARFASMPEGPLLERLLHVFSGLFDFYQAHPKVALAFVQAAVVPHDGPNGLEMDRLTIGTLGRIGELIHAAIARGELAADVPALLLAQNCFALYFSSLTAWLRRYVSTVEEAQGLLRIALDLQLRGLRR